MTYSVFLPISLNGLCAETDPDLFFPEKGGSAVPAKTLCFACPDRVACLDYALAHGESHGIWGGLTGRERRRLLRGEEAEENEAA